MEYQAQFSLSRAELLLVINSLRDTAKRVPAGLEYLLCVEYDASGVLTIASYSTSLRAKIFTPAATVLSNGSFTTYFHLKVVERRLAQLGETEIVEFRLSKDKLNLLMRSEFTEGYMLYYEVQHVER